MQAKVQQSNYGDEGRPESLTAAAAMESDGRQQGEAEKRNNQIKQSKMATPRGETKRTEGDNGSNFFI